MITIKIQIKALSADYSKKAIAFIQRLQSLYNKRNHLLLGKVEVKTSFQNFRTKTLAFSSKRQQCDRRYLTRLSQNSLPISKQSPGMLQTSVAFVPYIVPEDQRFQKSVVIKTQRGIASSKLDLSRALLTKACLAVRRQAKVKESTTGDFKAALPFSMKKEKLEDYFAHLNKALADLNQIKRLSKKYEGSVYLASWGKVFSLVVRTTPGFIRQLNNTLIFIDALNKVQAKDCLFEEKAKGRAESSLPLSFKNKDERELYVPSKGKIGSEKQGRSVRKPVSSCLSKTNRSKVASQFCSSKSKQALPSWGIRQPKEVVDLTNKASIPGPECRTLLSTKIVAPFARRTSFFEATACGSERHESGFPSPLGISQKVSQYTTLRSPFKYKKSREQFERKYIKNQLILFFHSTYSAYHYIQALKKLELPGIELFLTIKN